MGKDEKVKLGELISESDLEAYFDFEGVVRHICNLIMDDEMVQHYVYQEVRDKGHQVPPEYPDLVEGEILTNEIAIIKHKILEEEYWRAVTSTYRSLLLVAVGELER